MVDAAGPNGPFQPLALLHIRGEPRGVRHRRVFALGLVPRDAKAPRGAGGEPSRAGERSPGPGGRGGGAVPLGGRRAVLQPASAAQEMRLSAKKRALICPLACAALAASLLHRNVCSWSYGIAALQTYTLRSPLGKCIFSRLLFFFFFR